MTTARHPRVPEGIERVLRHGEHVLVSCRASYLADEGRRMRGPGAVLAVTPARWIDLGEISEMAVSWEWDDVDWMVAERIKRKWAFRFKPKGVDRGVGYHVSRHFADVVTRIQAGEISTTRLPVETTVAVPELPAERRDMTPAELTLEVAGVHYRCFHCDEQVGTSAPGDALLLLPKCPGCCRTVTTTAAQAPSRDEPAAASP
jgi:hypothetical protein